MPARVLIVSPLLLLAACEAPLHARAVEELGGEVDGVPPGPDHRPGQPCGACHGGDGPAESRFSFAGTLYRTGSVPESGSTVRFIDSSGQQHAVTSRCSGNFFVRASDAPLVPPIWVKVETTHRTLSMRSAVFREISCAACHVDPAGPSRVGRLVLEPDAGAPMPSPCP